MSQNEVPLVYHGSLVKIFDTVARGNFTFRYFWVANDWFHRKKSGELINGTNLVQFKLIMDKCKLMDNQKIGNVLAVSFNPRGRLWEGRILQDLEVITLIVVGFNKIKEFDENDPDNAKIYGDMINSSSKGPTRYSPPVITPENGDLPF